jgi:curli biogenesis system outer membrane secretion channel CsgG
VKRLACLLSVLFALVSIASAQKKRVAVMNFDYATVHSNVLSLWGGYDQDIGKGIADLLVDKLVTDGQYSVIERKALDKILAEQNFSNSDRADPTSAARLGKVLGVDAIIIGSITQAASAGVAALAAWRRKNQKPRSRSVRGWSTRRRPRLSPWLRGRESPCALARRL